MVMAQPETPVGWIPNLMLEDIHRLLSKTTVTFTADHVNGPSAPWHLRLLALLTGRNAGRFKFFAGAKWELLAESN
jgi:hypothetical protein